MSARGRIPLAGGSTDTLSLGRPREISPPRWSNAGPKAAACSIRHPHRIDAAPSTPVFRWMFNVLVRAIASCRILRGWLRGRREPPCTYPMPVVALLSRRCARPCPRTTRVVSRPAQRAGQAARRPGLAHLHRTTTAARLPKSARSPSITASNSSPRGGTVALRLSRGVQAIVAESVRWAAVDAPQPAPSSDEHGRESLFALTCSAWAARPIDSPAPCRAHSRRRRPD